MQNIVMVTIAWLVLLIAQGDIDKALEQKYLIASYAQKFSTKLKGTTG